MPCPPGWSSSASQCYTSPPVEGTWLECAALCTSHSWRGSPAALAVADSTGTAAVTAGVSAWTGAFAPNANITGCAYRASGGGLLEAPCLALFRCVCQWPVPPSVFACSSDGPCSHAVLDHEAAVQALEAAERAEIHRQQRPYLNGVALLALLPTLAILVAILVSAASKTWRDARLAAALQLGSRTRLMEPATDPATLYVARAVETLRAARRAAVFNRLRISAPCGCAGLFLHVAGLTPYLLPPPAESLSYGAPIRIGQPLFVLSPLTPAILLVLLSLLPTDGVAIRSLAGFICVLMLALLPPAVLDALAISSDAALQGGGVTAGVAARSAVAWANVLFYPGAVFALLPIAAASSRRLPPRRALLRLVTVVRVLFVATALTTAANVTASVLAHPVWPSATDPQRYCQAVEAAGFLLATMLSTPRCRRGFHGGLLRGGTGNRRAGALIAALLGNRSLRRALRKAAERFRCVAVDEVTEDDLLSPRDTGLHARSVDAFVSHSWGDDGTCKMAALRDWASEFEAAHGRRPTVWLDKGSIDQTSVAADLAGLPLYLLGCRSLLVLVGNTYGSRLWCVMEVFAWLQMGGRREDIHIVRLGSRCSLADDLSRFSLESSRCGLASDRERLLGAIEAAFGDFQPFNRCIRDIFAVDDRGEVRVCIGASVEGDKT